MPSFEPVVRTLLILEDDSDWMQILANLAKLSARRLRETIIIELKILKAASIGEALHFLEEYDRPIDIVSIDINLNMPDAVENVNTPFGGFGFLERFKDEKRTLSLIVSGENKISYPVAAFQTYGVLNYIPKNGSETEEIYLQSLETAFWYLSALDSITRPLAEIERPDIELAEIAWQNALEAAQRAKIHSHQFPQQLNQLIQDHRNRYIHPDTNLPIGDWTYHKLKRFILRGFPWLEVEPALERELPDWTILRSRLKGYGNFVRDYASQKQALMIIFARTLNSVMQDYQDYQVFTGQLDRDLPQGELDIIMILNTSNLELVQELEDKLAAHFKQSAPQVYPHKSLHPEFQAAHYPLELRFKTWQSVDDVDFTDMHSILDALNRGSDE